MFPINYIIFLQIIIFLFITPGTPRIVIISHSMNYLEGNLVKYVTRYKFKNGLEDLLKAKWYLDRLIEITIREGEKDETSK